MPDAICVTASEFLAVFLFNSFQIVAAFVAWPFLIAWLSQAEFAMAKPACVAAAMLYFIAFIAMVHVVHDSISREANHRR